MEDLSNGSSSKPPKVSKSKREKALFQMNFWILKESLVPVLHGFQPFSTQVNKEDFANTCYLQATLNGTNPAYLYALAFALSGG